MGYNVKENHNRLPSTTTENLMFLALATDSKLVKKHENHGKKNCGTIHFRNGMVKCCRHSQLVLTVTKSFKKLWLDTEFSILQFFGILLNLFLALLANSNTLTVANMVEWSCYWVSTCFCFYQYVYFRDDI